MKKLALAVAVTVLTATISLATISVNWQTTWGIDDPATPGSAADLPIGVVAQLIWSADGSINPLNESSPLVPQGAGADTEYLLKQINTSLNGYIYDGPTQYDATDAPWSLSEDFFVSGYVYQRIFNSATPGAGTWYYEGGLIGGPLVDQDPSPGTPDISDTSPSTFVAMNQQITGVIPEPTTWAFMGIGLLTIVIRRKFRK